MPGAPPLVWCARRTCGFVVPRSVQNGATDQASGSAHAAWHAAWARGAARRSYTIQYRYRYVPYPTFLRVRMRVRRVRRLFWEEALQL